jgi:hypothetical protein
MARDTSPRFAWVDIGKEDCDTLDDCRVKARINVTLDDLSKVDSGRFEEVIGFLTDNIMEWKGFDMELTPENVRSLTVQEAQAVSRAIVEAIQNPPKMNSEDS